MAGQANIQVSYLLLSFQLEGVKSDDGLVLCETHIEAHVGTIEPTSPIREPRSSLPCLISDTTKCKNALYKTGVSQSLAVHNTSFCKCTCISPLPCREIQSQVADAQVMRACNPTARGPCPLKACMLLAPPQRQAFPFALLLIIVLSSRLGHDFCCSFLRLGQGI